MFENQEFVKSVYNLKDLPEKNLPDVVLCGRSNVGKSSFINSLFNRKNLAKTSSTPGKTRSLNYYLIDNKFYLVDLPGYGYAKSSKKEREFWAKLIEDYIKVSGNIKICFHLIDSRHKPTDLDRQLNDLLKYEGISYLVLLNKADKLKQSEFISSTKTAVQVFPELKLGNNLFFYSAIKNIGRKEIHQRLAKLFYAEP